MGDARRAATLAELAAAPLRSDAWVREWGPTLVVAPHPDDEALGCGGAIALLRRAGVPVQVVVVSDGGMSHPRSKRYPRAALRALRESESVAGLAALGVDASAVSFLRLPDGAVPAAGDVGFDEAAARCRTAFAAIAAAPETVLAPWRRDPHRDHRAAWDLVVAAVAGARRPRLLEYPVWLWERGEPRDAPLEGEARAWRLDIEAVLQLKSAAIAAHRSQTTGLVDGPDGFRLGSAMLARFGRPWELYLEGPG